MPKEVLIPDDIDKSVEALLATKVLAATGEKKLVKLASKNAAVALNEKFDLIVRKQERTIGAVEKIRQCDEHTCAHSN